MRLYAEVNFNNEQTVVKVTEEIRCIRVLCTVREQKLRLYRASGNNTQRRARMHHLLGFTMAKVSSELTQLHVLALV